MSAAWIYLIASGLLASTVLLWFGFLQGDPRLAGAAIPFPVAYLGLRSFLANRRVAVLYPTLGRSGESRWAGLAVIACTLLAILGFGTLLIVQTTAATTRWQSVTNGFEPGPLPGFVDTGLFLSHGNVSPSTRKFNVHADLQLSVPVVSSIHFLATGEAVFPPTKGNVLPYPLSEKAFNASLHVLFRWQAGTEPLGSWDDYPIAIDQLQWNGTDYAAPIPLSSLDVEGDARSYPLDSYRVDFHAFLFLPRTMYFDPAGVGDPTLVWQGNRNQPNGLILPIAMQEIPSETTFTLITASGGSPTSFSSFSGWTELLYRRDPFIPILVITTALLPLLFGFLLLTYSFSLDEHDKLEAMFAAGFSSILTILPLRLVLVPSEVTGFTLLDQLLIVDAFGLLGVAAFIVLRATTSRQRGSTKTAEPT